MAKIIYALSGQGRGHASRVMAISDALRVRGHEVLFCCGGTGREVLEARGETVLGVPSLLQVMKGNEVRILPTLARNWSRVAGVSEIVANLSRGFSEFGPDLVITDFEAFSHRAAARLNVPVLSFNHQQIVTETTYSLPLRYRLNAFVAACAIRLIVPSRPEQVLITSFFYPPLKNPGRSLLVPPIIRPAVQALRPSRSEHVLVYINHGNGTEDVLKTLRRVDVPFVAYVDPPERPECYPNVRFKEPSLDEFLNDLASSRAVISTAGFTLMSEALYLGKPLLVIPNRGIFEQTLNALFLERNGLGMSVVGRSLIESDVTAFLERQPVFEKHADSKSSCGNKQAVACIESVLSRISPVPHPRRTLRTVAAASVVPTIGSLE